MAYLSKTARVLWPVKGYALDSSGVRARVLISRGCRRPSVGGPDNVGGPARGIVSFYMDHLLTEAELKRRATEIGSDGDNRGATEKWWRMEEIEAESNLFDAQVRLKVAREELRKLEGLTLPAAAMTGSKHAKAKVWLSDEGGMIVGLLMWLAVIGLVALVYVIWGWITRSHLIAL